MRSILCMTNLRSIEREMNLQKQATTAHDGVMLLRPFWNYDWLLGTKIQDTQQGYTTRHLKLILAKHCSWYIHADSCNRCLVEMDLVPSTNWLSFLHPCKACPSILVPIDDKTQVCAGRGGKVLVIHCLHHATIWMESYKSTSEMCEACLASVLLSSCTCLYWCYLTELTFAIFIHLNEISLKHGHLGSWHKRLMVGYTPICAHARTCIWICIWCYFVYNCTICMVSFNRSMYVPYSSHLWWLVCSGWWGISFFCSTMHKHESWKNNSAMHNIQRKRSARGTCWAQCFSLSCVHHLFVTEVAHTRGRDVVVFGSIPAASEDTCVLCHNW